VFDERGFLRIVDRKKDMIIVSGFNVYPNEVEATATACPGVAECACIGLPDEKTGEAVTLFVAKAPGATLTEADVIAHCRKEMTGYKVPKRVRFVEALPKSTVGKIPAPGVARFGLRCVRKLRPVLSAEVPSAGGRALRTECDGGGWLSTDGRKQSCSDILCPRSGASKRCSKRSLDTCR